MTVAGCQLPVASLPTAIGAIMGRSYKDLLVWQKAMDLVTAIYQSTAAFPTDERFGLTSQLRRAAVSIPSNIAEGQGRLSEREFRQFLGQARGSLMEVETQLQIAQNLGYIEPSRKLELLKACGEVGRILNGLMASICKPE
jgi:four helix bundle protein